VFVISLSSSEAATLTMHVYWRYHEETTEMHMRLKYDKDALGHEALLTIIPRIQVHSHTKRQINKAQKWSL
jgi:hypothetical protein